MSEFYVPQRITRLQREQACANQDQLAALFAGDVNALLDAQVREDEARNELLAIAEGKCS